MYSKVSTQIKQMRFFNVGKCDLWKNMQQGQGVKDLTARKVKRKYLDVLSNYGKNLKMLRNAKVEQVPFWYSR